MYKLSSCWKMFTLGYKKNTLILYIVNYKQLSAQYM